MLTIILIIIDSSSERSLGKKYNYNEGSSELCTILRRKSIKKGFFLRREKHQKPERSLSMRKL